MKANELLHGQDCSLPSPSSPSACSPPPPYMASPDISEPPAFALPPPALSDPFDATLDSKAIVLYVGRLSWEKNLKLLVEAYRQLPDDARSQSKPIFVGDGPARAELTRMCARQGLDATFMGHHKGTKLAALFASASFFAFPSYTETFGQVVLEAMASGLPVVGLKAPGTADLVQDGYTGVLLDVAPGTVGIPSLDMFRATMGAQLEEHAAGFAELLETMIRDRALRAAMGQRAREAASKRRWWDAMDVVVQGYYEVSGSAGVKRLEGIFGVGDSSLNRTLLLLFVLIIALLARTML